MVEFNIYQQIMTLSVSFACIGMGCCTSVAAIAMVVDLFRDGPKDDEEAS